MNTALLVLLLLTAAEPTVETSATTTTRLYVRTQPAGAEITLDGQAKGPSDQLFTVPPGVKKMTIEVTLDGFGKEQKTVQIEGGRITRVEFELEADPTEIADTKGVTDNESGAAESPRRFQYTFLSTAENFPKYLVLIEAILEQAKKDEQRGNSVVTIARRRALELHLREARKRNAGIGRRVESHVEVYRRSHGEGSPAWKRLMPDVEETNLLLADQRTQLDTIESRFHQLGPMPPWSMDVPSLRLRHFQRVVVGLGGVSYQGGIVHEMDYISPNLARTANDETVLEIAFNEQESPQIAPEERDRLLGKVRRLVDHVELEYISDIGRQPSRSFASLPQSLAAVWVCPNHEASSATVLPTPCATCGHQREKRWIEFHADQDVPIREEIIAADEGEAADQTRPVREILRVVGLRAFHLEQYLGYIDRLLDVTGTALEHDDPSKWARRDILNAHVEEAERLLEETRRQFQADVDAWREPIGTKAPQDFELPWVMENLVRLGKIEYQIRLRESASGHRFEFGGSPRGWTAEVRLRRFVRVTVGRDRVLLQGATTTLDDLPTLLAALPHPEETVLEVAFDASEMAEISSDERKAIVEKLLVPLADKLGMEYVSDIGRQPMDSVGSLPRTLAKVWSCVHHKTPFVAIDRDPCPTCGRDTKLRLAELFPLGQTLVRSDGLIQTEEDGPPKPDLLPHEGIMAIWSCFTERLPGLEADVEPLKEEFESFEDSTTVPKPLRYRYATAAQKTSRLKSRIEFNQKILEEEGISRPQVPLKTVYMELTADGAILEGKTIAWGAIHDLLTHWSAPEDRAKTWLVIDASREEMPSKEVKQLAEMARTTGFRGVIAYTHSYFWYRVYDVSRLVLTGITQEKGDEAVAQFVDLSRGKRWDIRIGDKIEPRGDLEIVRIAPDEVILAFPYPGIEEMVKIGENVQEALELNRSTRIQTPRDMLRGALSRYHRDLGSYPTTEQGLAALIAPPEDLEASSAWKGPYIRNTILPRDKWGRVWTYSCDADADSYELSCSPEHAKELTAPAAED